ncbi:DedA family protein [archaeon]|nr:MAG: DedA family protein [archaeon]
MILMFDSVIALLAAFAHQYGLLGLFASSAIGSTIFVPFSVELVLVPLTAAGLNPVLLVLAAAIGSLLGSFFNYALGFYGTDWFEKRFMKKKSQKEEIRKAEELADKYGWLGLFVLLSLPIPLPVDALTILAGASKMELKIFMPVIFFSKFIKYSIVVGLLKFLGL